MALIIIPSLQQHQSCALVGMCIKRVLLHCQSHAMPNLQYNNYYFFSKTTLSAKGIRPGGQETQMEFY